MSEQEYRKRFLLDWQKENPEGRLYRINSGVAWVANKPIIENIKGLIKVTLLNARRFFGAPKHSPDLWGYAVKEVPAPCCGSCKSFDSVCMDGISSTFICKNQSFTKANLKKDIVGDLKLIVKRNTFPCNGKHYQPLKTQKKAIFTWVELKTKKDKITKGQQKKIDQLNAVGGIGKIEREE